MLNRVIRGYKQRIHFKRGVKQNIVAPTLIKEPVEDYHRPQYLALKKELSAEEIDLLNQGGAPPPVHWKKIPALTDIHYY